MIPFNKPYLTGKETHYIYDARTGDQHWFKGLIHSFRIAMIYQVY